jgi:type II secretory pathway component GspD/PulD (secretin)
VLLLTCGAGTGQGPSRAAAAPKPTLIPLVQVGAEYAAAKLRSLLGPGAEVTADKESNTILLRANAKEVERARGRLARLDAPRYTYVARLENAGPAPVARVIGAVMAVLAILGGDPEVPLVPLERDRAILFTATDAQARRLRWLVRQLDRRW